MKTALPVLCLPLFLALPVGTFGGESATNLADPVATVAGQPISEQELLESLGPQMMQLRKQEYEIKSKALENLIRQKLAENEAKKRGLTADKLLEQEVDAKIASPTAGEVEAFYLAQRDRINRPLSEVRPQVEQALKQARIQRARQDYLDSLREKADVAVLLRPPSIEVAYDPARVIGDPKAPVTIVEFSDYQCPFCKKTEDALKSLLTKYNGRVKLAYRDYPLHEIHPYAQSAAAASRCAGEQGKFWEFHDALFADQSKLKEPDLIADAKALHLDEKSFQSCLASGKFKAQIEADRQEGSKVGVNGTPGFFVNGVFLGGAQPKAEFEKIIDAALASAGHSTPVAANK